VKYRYPKAGGNFDGPMQKDAPESEGELNEAQKKLAAGEPAEQEFTEEFEINYKVVNKTKPFISQKEFKVLYIGINNPVEIYHPDFNPSEYKTVISQGELIRKGNQFYAKVNREGFCTIGFSVPDKANGGMMKVSEETFKVKYLPKPEVVLFNKTGGDIAAKIFKQQKGLETSLKALELDEDFKVTEYTVTYVNGNGLGIFKESVKGSYFTGKSKELIDLAQPGDIFIFDNIYVKGPDGQNKNVEALVFKIN
jgi:hypothetical protein